MSPVEVLISDAEEDAERIVFGRDEEQRRKLGERDEACLIDAVSGGRTFAQEELSSNQIGWDC